MDETSFVQKFGPKVIYFGLGITENRPAGAFWADKNLILGRNGVPQGPFWAIKFYFTQKKRPAGAFWADKIVCQEKASRRGLLVAQKCQKYVQEAQSSI